MRKAVLRSLPLAALFFVSAISADPDKVPVSQRLKDGEAIYNYACSHCHDTGEGGAPVVGESEGWQDRSRLWEAVLFEHAQKGYLAMPAGGGDARLTDYDIEVAAEYMAQRSNPDMPED